METILERYDEGKYQVLPGPEGLLPPSATSQRIVLPDPGEGLVNGNLLSEEKVMEEIAKQFLSLRNPTIFPGPLILWGWDDHTMEKATAVLELRDAIPGCNIIPMPDYRPIYPQINPVAVINPCHPNLTIWYNKINVCAFIGVHCHYANISLKIVRGGTTCFTIALCAEAGHEDAMATLRDMDAAKIRKQTDVIKKMIADGFTPWATTKEGQEELEQIKAFKKEKKEQDKIGTERYSIDAYSGELVEGLDEYAE